MIPRRHHSAYVAERGSRWALERSATPAVLTLIHTMLTTALSLPSRQLTFRRFDQDWFAAYPPDQQAWVRGAPDYCGTLWADPLLFLFLELKLKQRGIFRKTISGGVTRNGSVIASYHCPSFYLDVDPVFKNMSAFCLHTHLSPRHFLVVFAKPDAAPADIHLITLQNIHSLVRDGWQGVPLQKFDEGYGRRAYLIPQDATMALSRATVTDIIHWCSLTCPLPRFPHDFF